MRLLFVLLLLAPDHLLADRKPEPGVFTVAVFGEAVYIGQAFSKGDRGTFVLEGFIESDGSCTGSFRYQDFPRGMAKFECSNGLSGSVRIRGDKLMSGRGRGLHDGRKIELVYGYDLKRTNQLLDFPGGREIQIRGEQLVLALPD